MSTNKVLLVGHVLHWCILVLTTTVHTSGIGESGGHSRNEGEKKLKLPGDIIFGGLFPMHEKGPVGKNCGKVKEEKGIQRMEAMLYAVDKINNDDSLLPNITLGVHILDTCSRDSYALEQSMDFIRAQFNNFDEGNYQCKDGRLRKYVKSRPVAGVIGAASSSVSVMVANILRLFKIPQISYASTSEELSDKSRFEYFSRVVPPDTFQAQAMVDIAKALGWTYISTVADEGNYGEKGIAEFEELAKNEGLCIAQSLKIPRDPSKDLFETTITDLAKKPNAKGVVMFVNEDNCKSLLRATIDLNKTGDFYWLASDSWGAKIHPVEGQEEAAEGAITILPKRKVLTEFDDYFKRLNASHSQLNPWFAEFWEQHFECRLNDSKTGKNCSEKRLGVDDHYEQEGLVQFVVDAVYALAYALQSLHNDTCSSPGLCKEMRPTDGATVLSYIRNVSFNGSAGTTVRFSKSGDGQGRYNIFQYQLTNSGEHQYIPIGEWTDRLKLDMSKTHWRYDNDTFWLPRSVCSEPCGIGQAKNVKGEPCCWLCIPCSEYEILYDESTCISCANGTMPNHNKTACEALPIQHMLWNSPWAIVPAAVASFGIISTLFVIVTFIRYNATPVIMASGRELCYVLLCGLFMCYVMTFVLISKPSAFSCALMRLGIGLSLSICFSALFTKTNRISRIFNRGVKGLAKRPSYTSPKSQLVICGCLISVQLIGASVWLILDIPNTTRAYPNRETVILRCEASELALVLSLLYNMLLITLCTVYAFKTRKIPENFNEAKYIAFTMYSTCIVWSAFIPIYFGTNQDFKIQITTLCMCLSISATAALGCLFAPKVYIVLFQPHKNVRQTNSTMMNSASSKSIRPFFGKSGTVGSSLGNHNDVSVGVAQNFNSTKSNDTRLSDISLDLNSDVFDEAEPNSDPPE